LLPVDRAGRLQRDDELRGGHTAALPLQRFRYPVETVTVTD
jgi:hypothetical protein